jgi:Calx-beta domain/FG-GAP-like repeat/Bacterial Ig domain
VELSNLSNLNRQSASALNLESLNSLNSTNTSFLGASSTANTAPILSDRDVQLNSIDEDAGSPVGGVGTLVSQLIDLDTVLGGLDNFSDLDKNAVTGIAVIGTDSSNGNWFYSIDNGAEWNQLFALESSTRLLAADSNTRIYFQPRVNYNGTSGISFRAWDRTTGFNGSAVDISGNKNGDTTAYSTGVDTATITINPINDAPVLDAAKTPKLVVVNEDAEEPVGEVGTLVSDLVDLSIVKGGLDNVSDADKDAVAGIAIASADSTNGTWFYNTDGVVWNRFNSVSVEDSLLLTADGITRIYFQPQTNYSGEANLTFRAWDGMDNSLNGDTASTVKNGGITAFSSAVDTINATINAINNEPFNNVPDAQNINEDTTLIFSKDNGNIISVSDIDAGNSTIQVTLTATNGNLTVGSSQDVKIAGNTTGNVLLWGTIAAINTLLDGFSFKPNKNFNGDSTIQIVTNDLGNTGTGGKLTDIDTIKITINPVNNAPSFLKGIDQLVDEDAGEKIISNWVTNINAGAENESQQKLKFIVSNNNQALFAEQPSIAADGTLTYKPAENVSGTATVSVQLQDDDGITNGGNDISTPQTFTIKVNSINDAPVNNLPGDSYTINEDESIVFSASKNNGITISDVDAGTNNVEVNLTTTNAIFTINNNNSVNITGNQTANLKLTGTVSNINTALNGLIFRPDANFNGDTKIKIVSSDLGSTGTGTTQSDIDSISVRVTSINDLPSFTKGGNQTINEDGGLQTIKNWATRISMGANNETQQKHTFIISTDNDALFAEKPSISPNGTLTYKPADNLNGIATVNVKLQDDGGIDNGGVDTSTVQTFAIAVNPVNDTPSFTKGQDQIINEDAILQTINNWASNISSGALNESNQIVEFIVTNSNNQLFEVQPRITSDGILVYKPAANINGNASITVKLKDNGGNLNGAVDTSPEQTFNIIVNSVNDAPKFSKGDNIIINAGAGKQTLRNWAKFAPGAANESTQTVLEYSISSNSNPELFKVAPTIDNAGNLVFTPINVLEKPVTATITVKVQDNGGITNDGVDTSSEQTFTITVNPLLINIAPAVNSINEGDTTTTEYNFTVNLSSPSSETVTVNYTTADDSATITDKDYVEKLGVISFAPGETSKIIKVLVNGDRKYEVDQAFKVNLTNPNQAVLGTSTATGIITNDDKLPTVSIKNVTKREGNAGTTTPLVFAVDLSNPSDEEVKVSYATSDGTATNNDYIPFEPGILTFAPNQTSQTITVEVNGDNDFETNETFFVSLSNAINAIITLDTRVIGTILNDEGANDTDFNGDGNPDLVWRNYQTGENAIWLMKNTELEQGIFLTKVDDIDWKIEQIADFNSDRKVDLLWRNYRTGENAIWLMNGTTLEKSVFIDRVIDTQWKITGVADFDNDGKVDILWRSDRTGENSIWFMNDTTIKKAEFITKVDENNWKVEELGDFNRDGKVDILWRNYRTGENAIWLMNGKTLEKGIFITKVDDINWEIEAVNDFNRDGKVDILWRNYRTGENSIWLMNGTELDKGVFIPKVDDINWEIEQISDFTNDGKVDIVWRNYSSGVNAIWQMNDNAFDKSFEFTRIGDIKWEIVD